MPSGNGDVDVNFCSHCGAGLDESTNYCPQCGTKCRETTPREQATTTRTASATTESTGGRGTAGRTGQASSAQAIDGVDHERFRRRVGDHLVDGWEIEHDQGDSVLLRKREYGSVGVHVLLFLFTWGIGNLAYGWYKYAKGGDRRLLRADGDDTYSLEPGSSPYADQSDSSFEGVPAYLGGALALVVALAMLASLDLFAMVFSVFFFVAALWMMPATRRRLKDRHPPTSFGHVHTTDETTRVDPDKPCVVCSKAVEEGVERSYRKEYVVAGIPLFTTDSGENQYCRSCASGGLSEYDQASRAVEDPVADTEH
ncbi:zinc-ribbon domain-containing protein [Halomarina salina]|uniref:Zinc-ribbon domain-containing protein n=1 Tax=Halomarina salina TaxID=1872699 RepID=A0ABD5RRG6_9EURY|nr:zinc ribbon domain-containing protein [Halomarina salina]